MSDAVDVREIIHGYEIQSKWKNGQRGVTALATRGGKKFFIKKYTKFVLPTDDGMFDERTKAMKKDSFNAFHRVRKRVIDAIAPAAGAGGNIVIPCDSFVDGIHYYEVTEFIDGVIPDDELQTFLDGLSYDEKLLMMKTAAGALSAVHSAGVIHSDLKLKNIIVVRNSLSNFVAKLIDFDSSYPSDEKKFIGGDDVYCSPELAEYAATEDEEEMEALARRITAKTDIFSLGIVYHYYLSGEFPDAVALSERLRTLKERRERAGKPSIFYTYQLLDEGCELKLSDKITSVNLKCLILDMLEKDPEKRPTAMQVLMRLKDGEPTVTAPAPEHKIKLEAARLAADGIVGLKPIRGEAKYEVIFSTGRKVFYTKDELVSLGYAKAEVVIPECFGEHWPEHAFEFNTDKLRSRNYVSAVKDTMAGKNGYRLYTKDGASRFFTVEKLLMLEFAFRAGSAGTVGETAPAVTPARVVTRSIPEAVDTVCEPWPEHAIEFDPEMIRTRGYTGVEQGTMSGINGYYLRRPDGGRRFIRVEMMIVQRMALKK